MKICKECVVVGARKSTMSDSPDAVVITLSPADNAIEDCNTNIFLQDPPSMLLGDRVRLELVMLDADKHQETVQTVEAVGVWIDATHEEVIGGRKNAG